MDSERLREIEKIYHAGLEIAPAGRGSIFTIKKTYLLRKAILPRWLVTVRLAEPSPVLPTTRRPSLTKLKPELENEPSWIFRVEGAVATSWNEEFAGIRKLILPRIESKR